MKPIIDSPIDAGSEYGNYLGFSDKLFSGYLWDKNDGFIIISLVISLSPRDGNFSLLLNSICAKGYGVKIPTPLSQMRRIVKHYGFKQTLEYDKQLETLVEIWVLQSK